MTKIYKEKKESERKDKSGKVSPPMDLALIVAILVSICRDDHNLHPSGHGKTHETQLWTG